MAILDYLKVETGALKIFAGTLNLHNASKYPKDQLAHLSALRSAVSKSGVGGTISAHQGRTPRCSAFPYCILVAAEVTLASK